MDPSKGSSLRGFDLLSSKYFNKSTAFTATEREARGLRGLLPPRVGSLELQLQRTYAAFKRMATPLDKYIYLQLLEDRNQTLFYALVLEHMEEMMPIVYTPTVGQACIEYGQHFRRPKGLYISLEDLGHVEEILHNWPATDVRSIVVTDGARILGLGDLGCNGMPIPVGKLMLFTACGGVDPAKCIPVTLDVGTNNQKLLNDPLYPGLPRPRARGPEAQTLIDEFIAAVQKTYKDCLVQFEDFGNENAFHLLEHYRDKICTFNDDIQGTAAVALAGIMSSMKKDGSKFSDHKFLFLGAGEAARGIADLIVAAAVREGSLTEQEAISRCFLCDSKGLVVAARKGELQEHKIKYAHEVVEHIRSFEECVEKLQPTAIIGVSGQGATFTESIVRKMAQMNKCPIIFPLSNPTSCSECTAEQAFAWTGGRVHFASGSPFDPVKLPDGKTVFPTQANNVYVFPGIAQGVLVSRAKHVTDAMFLAASDMIVDLVTEEERTEGRLFPSVRRIRFISEKIATRVAQIALDTGLAGIPQPNDLAELVRSSMYEPRYPELA